jgi:outer membrane protein assembly factor BamB
MSPTRRAALALLGSAVTAGCLDGVPGTGGDADGIEAWIERIEVTEGPATAATAVDPPGADAWPSAKRDAAATASAPADAAPAPPLAAETLTATGQEAMRVPAVDGDRAVCLTGHPDAVLRCLDPATGDRRWSQARDDLGHASPAMADGTAFVPWGYYERDEHLTAVDAATGAERWEVDLARSPACDPVAAGGTVYVGTDGGALVTALDAAGGERCFTLSLPDPTSAVTRLAVAGGRLYAGTLGFASDVPDTGHVLAYDPAAGEVVWGVETGRPIRDLAVTGGTAHVVTDDRALAIDGQSGGERWRRDVEGGAPGAVAVDGDRVYVGTGDGVRALAADGSERWGGDGGPAAAVGVAVAGDAVYAAGRDGLAVIDAGDGRVRWRDGAAVAAGGPVLAGGRAYLGTDDGRLVGYVTDASGSDGTEREATGTETDRN